MNNQEAIEVIKLAQAQIEWDYPMDYTVAFDMAISALQEQEAKHSIESSLTQNALDLISRQAAIDKADSLYRDTKNDECYMITGYNHAISDIRAILKSLPSAQPERKKGKWIPQDHNKTNGIASTLVYYCPKCSVCGHCDNYTNFCSNCGADMRGKIE